MTEAEPIPWESNLPLLKIVSGRKYGVECEEEKIEWT